MQADTNTKTRRATCPICGSEAKAHVDLGHKARGFAAMRAGCENISCLLSWAWMSHHATEGEAWLAWDRACRDAEEQTTEVDTISPWGNETIVICCDEETYESCDLSGVPLAIKVPMDKIRTESQDWEMRYADVVGDIARTKVWKQVVVPASMRILFLLFQTRLHVVVVDDNETSQMTERFPCEHVQAHGRSLVEMLMAGVLG